MRSGAPRSAFAIVSIVLVVAALGLAKQGVVQHQSFKAFYCAGAAVREHRDPYRVEPLRSCELRVSPAAVPQGYVEPAPLPGYALAPFALLAALPAREAAYVFALALAIATLLSAWCMAELLRAPAAAVLLAFAPLALLNIAYGEIPPIAVLAMCAAAYLLRTGRPVWAGIAVSLALLQPNVGVTAVLAVFLLAPAARVAVLVCGGALAALSIAVLGLSGNVEYIASVLPLQANAELIASDQYSLGRLLSIAGVAPGSALVLAKISFVVMAAVGVCAAGILALRSRNPDALPLIPPACVLLGGIYLHDIQMLFALPAALLVASRARGRVSAAFGVVALALLITVWTQRVARATFVMDAVGVAAGVFAVLRGAVGRRVVYASATAIAVIACVVALQHLAPPVPTREIVTGTFGSSPNELAPAAWARYLQATPALTRPEFVLKLPTWFALVLLVLGALQMSLARDPGEGKEPTLGRSEPHEPPLASAW